jgi:hypothetical protein
VRTHLSAQLLAVDGADVDNGMHAMGMVQSVAVEQVSE